MAGEAREPASAVVVGVSDGGVAGTGEEPHGGSADDAAQGRAHSCGPLGKRPGGSAADRIRDRECDCGRAQRSLRRQVATALDAVQNNRGLAVPFTLRDLERLPRKMVVAELKARYANAEPQHKLGLAYAMAHYGEVDAPFLVSRIQRSAPEEVDNLVAAFGRARQASSEAIHDLAKKATAEKNWRLKARLAVVALHLEDDRDRRRHVPHRRSARSGPAHDLHR